MKSLHEYDREMHSLYKQRKARMIGIETYRDRREILKQKAYNIIKKWQCPSCLGYMAVIALGDPIAEFRCQCGKFYTRKWLLSLNGESRSEIRRRHLAFKLSQKAEYEGYMQNNDKRDNSVRVSGKHKEKHKNQKGLDSFTGDKD